MVSEELRMAVQLIANFNDLSLRELVRPADKATAETKQSASRYIRCFRCNKLNFLVVHPAHHTTKWRGGCACDPGECPASGCVSHPSVQDRRWNTRTETSAPKGKGPRVRRSIPMARFCVNRLPGSAETSQSSVICRTRFPSPPRRSGFCVHSFPTRSVPSCAVTADGGEYR